MGFSRDELERCRDRAVPDLLDDGVRLLIVGINPSLWTAATQAHFAHPGNRFWPALLRAGLITRPIDVTAGMQPGDRDHVLQRGIGITNLVNRATARADELHPDELQAGADRLRAVVDRRSPRVVAVAGITAYRTAFGVRRASRGPQPEAFGPAQLWVVPNPSGLNAHETVESLARADRDAGRNAGLVPDVATP